MAVILMIAISMLLWRVYYRYAPVVHMEKMNFDDHVTRPHDYVLVDTRDYQTSDQTAVSNAVCLPLPYLNRHYRDIPDKEVVLICSDAVEKNLAARLLRKKGCRVSGYVLTKQKDKECKLECVFEK